jgi:hypothetical protein
MRSMSKRRLRASELMRSMVNVDVYSIPPSMAQGGGVRKGVEEGLTPIGVRCLHAWGLSPFYEFQGLSNSSSGMFLKSSVLRVTRTKFSVKAVASQFRFAELCWSFIYDETP